MPGLLMFVLILVCFVAFICYSRISKVERYVVSVHEHLEAALDEYDDKYVCFDLLEEASNVILQKAAVQASQQTRALVQALYPHLDKGKAQQNRHTKVQAHEGKGVREEEDVTDDSFLHEEDMEYHADGDILQEDTEMTQEDVDTLADSVPPFKNLIKLGKTMNKSSVNEPHPYHVEGMAEVMSSVANIFGKMGGTHEVHAFLSSPGATTTALLAQNLSNMSSQALHPAMQANSPYIYELDEYDCDVDLPVHVEDPGDDSI
jgi:hypothetical protein